ncbi:MAG: Inorganic pyrophosphatase, partial [Candidatus Collierbacteria bacterium GW2011_GWF1_42_50]
MLLSRFLVALNQKLNTIPTKKSSSSIEFYLQNFPFLLIMVLYQKRGVTIVDRILSTKLSFPFNYGFVPETWSNDNDPLDAVVLSSKPQNTGAVIESRIIGLLATKDEKGTDAKLITVPSSETNPIFTKINTIEDLDEQTLNNIQYFYKNYKIIEPGKWVDIDGYASKEEAESKLKIAIE